MKSDLPTLGHNRRLLRPFELMMMMLLLLPSIVEVVMDCGDWNLLQHSVMLLLHHALCIGGWRCLVHQFGVLVRQTVSGVSGHRHRHAGGVIGAGIMKLLLLSV